MSAMNLLSVVAFVLFLGGCGVDASSASPSGEPEEPETQVSDFRSVNGTRFLIAFLHGERGRSSYSSDSYYGGAALNHLFYDRDGRSARWLLPGLDQRILETRPLTSAPDSTAGDASISPRNGGGGELRAFLYRVVSEDTNGDGDLDSDDRSALATSDPSETGGGLPPAMKIPAEQCAREAIAGFEKGKALVFPGRAYKVLMTAQSVVPRPFQRWVMRKPSLEARAEAEREK